MNINKIIEELTKHIDDIKGDNHISALCYILKKRKDTITEKDIVEIIVSLYSRVCKLRNTLTSIYDKEVNTIMSITSTRLEDILLHENEGNRFCFTHEDKKYIVTVKVHGEDMIYLETEDGQDITNIFYLSQLTNFTYKQLV